MNKRSGWKSRKWTKNEDDKIQELTQVNFKVLYGEGYKDKGHPPTITLLFEN